MAIFQIKKKPESYDAIVVGTGITGGWAAKELCGKGLKTLVIERGREVKHGDYPTAHKDPWEFPNYDRTTESDLHEFPKLKRFDQLAHSNLHWWMKDAEQPYIEKKPFLWVRGDQVGGRSIMWRRRVYRWSDMDFEANLRDGTAIDWPIRYADLADWYDYVESYIGVSGRAEGHPGVPDGKFLPPMDLNCIERHFADGINSSYNDRIVTVGRVANLTVPHNGRDACSYRDRCNRGCPYGAYFSSLSSTLPAAEATNKMTLLADTIVAEVLFDDATQRAIGVRVMDKITKQIREYHSNIVFLNASAFNSTWLLMNSRSNRFPNGMGNDSGVLGHFAMDHYIGGGAVGKWDGDLDKYYKGRKPNGIYIPRFRNIPGIKESRPPHDFTRGYHFQGTGTREDWNRSIPGADYGANLKQQLSMPGRWQFGIMGLGEMLPRFENFISLHPEKKDQYGLPILVMNIEWSKNELNMGKDMVEQAVEMLSRAGLVDVNPVPSNAVPASAVHEMGTARMGHDEKTSVLNKWNQIHAVKHVFVTHGACMTSSACQNPSLTYMALTARAANFAVHELKKGNL